MIFKNDLSFTTVTVEDLRADAEKKTELLRQLTAEFQPDRDKGPLTPAELRLASGTPLLFIEHGAAIADASPAVSGAAKQDAASIMRVGIEAELAYGKVLAQAEELVRQIRMNMRRTKLAAVNAARDVYHVAQGFVQTDNGDVLKLHFEQMKLSRRRPARRTTPPTTDTTTK